MFLTRDVEPFVFNAIVADIYILPSRVIDPLVLYYRQWQVLAASSDDLRSEAFQTLSQVRKAAVYEDFRALGIYTIELAKDAIDVLNASLRDEES